MHDQESQLKWLVNIQTHLDRGKEPLNRVPSSSSDSDSDVSTGPVVTDPLQSNALYLEPT